MVDARQLLTRCSVWPPLYAHDVHAFVTFPWGWKRQLSKMFDCWLFVKSRVELAVVIHLQMTDAPVNLQPEATFTTSPSYTKLVAPFRGGSTGKQMQNLEPAKSLCDWKTRTDLCGDTKNSIDAKQTNFLHSSVWSAKPASFETPNAAADICEKCPEFDPSFQSLSLCGSERVSGEKLSERQNCLRPF